MPAQADGSNGGNLLFIINLIKFMQEAIKNPIIIICKREKKTFLEESLSFDNPNYEFKEIKILDSYQKAMMLLHPDGAGLISPILFKSSSILATVVIRLLGNINTIENRASRKYSSLINHSNTIFEKVALKLFFIGVIITRKCSNQLKSTKKNVPHSDIKAILFSPFGHFDSIAPRFKRIVSIIYDLQHIDLPFMFSAKEIDTRNFHYSKIINFSSNVITISNFSKQRISNNFGIKDDHIKVIHLPPQITKNNDGLEPKIKKDFADLQLNKAIKEGNFFFVPANFWKHKNHKTLLVAINMFTRINQDITFIFSGKFTSCEKKEFDDFSRFNNLNKRVWILGYIDSNSIEFLYRQCLAVISPSLYEGFGMTLVEAKFYCKVSIVSNIMAHKETADTAATIFFDPRNPKDILEKLIFFVNSDKKNYTFNKVINPKEVYQEYTNCIVGETLEF